MSRPQLSPEAGAGSGWAQVRHVLATVAAVVGRWALRLGLPVAGAALVLQAFPYQATLQGVPFTVRGTLFGRPGLTAQTTLGSWEFPDVTEVPIGVVITPRDVDLLQLAEAAGTDPDGFVQRLQADATEQLPAIVTWLVAEVVIGVLLGLLAAAAFNMSLRYLRGAVRRPDELRLRLAQLGGAVGVLLLVIAYGWVTYNPDWTRQSRLTGTFAAAQLFPDQLSQFYWQNNKAYDVLGSVIGIQAALQEDIAEGDSETALRIMFISDMHLSENYPLVGIYARNYDVDLIINTGDESLFGTEVELTSAYIAAVTEVAAETPMLWVAGNHDSPTTEQTMRSVPGVTVLGSKERSADGFEVRAGYVEAFGLVIAGVPDPRVYGAPHPYGADEPAITGPLYRETVRAALAEVVADDAADRDPSGTPTRSPSGGGNGAPDVTALDFDIFAAHAPVQVEELREQLPERIRQTVAGHVHRQNDPDELQSDGLIDLIEGSTGAGGLYAIVEGQDRPPIEFSIQSVAPDCQFTRVLRFRIDSTPVTASAAAEAASPESLGNAVTATTRYYSPQEVADDRVCDSDLGISDARPL